MSKFYTAVGKLQLKNNEKNQKLPVILLNKKEHLVSQHEMIIWSELAWRIYNYDELFGLFKKNIKDNTDEPQTKTDFDNTILRLENRGLISTGINKNDILAIYNLMADIILIPSTGRLYTNIFAFVKLTFFDKIPFYKTKRIFNTAKLDDGEKVIISMVRKNKLTTSEIIYIVNNGVPNNFSNLEKHLDKLSLEDEKTFTFSELEKVITIICNLYFKKLIQFDRE